MADIKGKLKNDLKNMPYIRQFLHEYFDLGKDKDNEAVTVESIRNLSLIHISEPTRPY